MRIASWSWGGRLHVGTIAADGREATPLAVADATRGALPLIEALARGEPLPPPAPERGVKAATFRLLLETAMTMIQQDGHVPSIAEMAARAKVSRATTYRYFPSRSALVTAVVDASLGPVRAFASSEADGRARVHQLFVQTFPRFTEFEPQMRAAAQLALEQWALERAGLLEEEPYRRGHRVRILEHALEPLARTLPTATRDRLHRALSVVYGIEPYMVLKDIWGSNSVKRGKVWTNSSCTRARPSAWLEWKARTGPSEESTTAVTRALRLGT